MKRLLLLLLSLILGASLATSVVAQEGPPPPPHTSTAAGPAIAVDQENVGKAKALLDKAIHALGGEAYLGVRDLQQEGRTYSFHHGRQTGNGVQFWRFVEFPDKERIEVTKQRDIAVLYNGDKGYEITY